MKTYCVLLSIVGGLMVVLNLAVLLFFQHSIPVFRLYSLVEFLFGAFGLLAFGLYLMIFCSFVHNRLIREERQKLLNSFLN